MRLADAAPVIVEEVTCGKLKVLALYSATVKKNVNPSGKIAVAGCKVWVTLPSATPPALHGCSAACCQS
jgi:hypothetical protein